jgi:hypothetical protein
MMHLSIIAPSTPAYDDYLLHSKVKSDNVERKSLRLAYALYGGSWAQRIAPDY